MFATCWVNQTEMEIETPTVNESESVPNQYFASTVLMCCLQIALSKKQKTSKQTKNRGFLCTVSVSFAP